MGFVHHALNRTTEVVFGEIRLDVLDNLKSQKVKKEVKRLSFRIMNLRFSCF